MEKKNDLPKISVLISVFNQLHCLDKALSSVLTQDYLNIEVIVGDDFSTDGNVGSFIDQFNDHRVKYVRNEKNLGANGNYYNMLHQWAQGTYAIVLNADDYWIDDQFLSRAVEIFQRHPDVNLVFGEVKTYISSDQIFIEDKVHKKLPKILSGNQFFINYPKGYALPHLSCIYIRKKAIDLDFYNSNVVSTDWEYLLKIILGHHIGILHYPVGVLTKHAQNYTKDTHLDDLFIADSYIDNLYNFAMEKDIFNGPTLAKWRHEMLRRHHTKWLIKLWFLDPQKLPEYEKHVLHSHPKIYRQIKGDIRYRTFVQLRKSSFLLKFMFRNFYKRESFIADLIAFKHDNNGV